MMVEIERNLRIGKTTLRRLYDKSFQGEGGLAVVSQDDVTSWTGRAIDGLVILEDVCSTIKTLAISQQGARCVLHDTTVTADKLHPQLPRHNLSFVTIFLMNMAARGRDTICSSPFPPALLLIQRSKVFGR